MSPPDGFAGAALPPPGVTPNPEHPESIAWQLILSSCLGPAVTIPIVTLRLYTAAHVLKRYHLDDYLIIVALVFAVANSVLSIYQTKNGAGMHIWDVSQAQFQQFMKDGSIGGSLTYNLGTLFIKASILCYYTRFSIDRALRLVTYGVLMIAVGYSIANAFIFAYLCRPMAAYWDFSIQGTCLDVTAAYIATSALNVATDIIILLLPIWMLWPLRVPPLKKFYVTLILMAGGFYIAMYVQAVLISLFSVCGVSIVRLRAILAGATDPDISWHYVTNLIWCLTEMYTGIICACLPCLKAFVVHVFPNSPFFREDSETKSRATSLALSFNHVVAPGARTDSPSSWGQATQQTPATASDGKALRR